jgi:DNA-binding transcriptional ArsR family regulator
MEISKVVGSFEALAHETRLGVLRLLIPAGRNGLAAGDIGKRLDLPPNSLSFHLARLVNAGLIVSRRSGRNLFYAADYARVDDLVRFLADNCCADAPEGCFPECPTLAQPPSLGRGSASGVPGTDASWRK